MTGSLGHFGITTELLTFDLMSYSIDGKMIWKN